VSLAAYLHNPNAVDPDDDDEDSDVGPISKPPVTEIRKTRTRSLSDCNQLVTIHRHAA